MRLSRLSYFITMAGVVALRSTCPRARVGSVLVNPLTNQVVAVGYNGSVSGAPHCEDTECLKISTGIRDHPFSCVRTVHAETNAVLHLEHNYPELYLYTTHRPCYQCTKILITANVKKVFYQKEYEDSIRDAILKESKLPLSYMVKVP